VPSVPQALGAFFSSQKHSQAELLKNKPLVDAYIAYLLIKSPLTRKTLKNGQEVATLLPSEKLKFTVQPRWALRQCSSIRGTDVDLRMGVARWTATDETSAVVYQCTSSLGPHQPTSRDTFRGLSLDPNARCITEGMLQVWRSAMLLP